MAEMHDIDAVENELWGSLREIALSEAIKSQLPAKCRLLDVGCGDGYLLSQIAITHKEGIDASKIRISRAKKRVKNAIFKEGDVYKLPYKDNSFEVVVCSELLEHLEEPVRALKELKRVCSDTLIITVPNNQDLVPLVCPQCKHRHYLSGHIQRFTEDRLKSIGSECGLICKKAIRFHTIFSYNKVSLHLPRVLRRLFDQCIIHLEPLLGFCKGNYLLMRFEV